MSETQLGVEPLSSSQAQQRLRHYPVSFFAVVLGMLGLTLATQKAHQVLGVPWALSTGLLVATALLTVVIVGTYAVKAALHPASVREEFAHPVRVNFFPILAKIPLILAIILLERSMVWSHAFWVLGAALQFFFSLVIVSRWMGKEARVESLSPAWFIPIVGSVIVPIAGVAHGYREISWFFFSVGLLFWLALFVVVLNRLIFYKQLPAKLAPTLFILFAPPAIAFIAYTKLTGGELDVGGRVLYFVSLFLFFLVLTKVRLLARLPFFLSWWAYTFPLAALTLATFLMHHLNPTAGYNILAGGMLTLLGLIVLVVGSRTLRAVGQRQLCVEEE